MRKVSIQGIKGAFHEEAAHSYFGEELQIIPNLTFKDLIKSVENRNVDFGIIAIENTISGTIKQNLQLIRDHQVQICGEQKIRIIQHLGALAGTKMNDIKEVRSHYMAINQCRKYFSDFPKIKLIDEEDTALSVKNIAHQGLKNVGAIGSKNAMNHYNLEIIEESIESNKLNFTRFYIIKKSDDQEYLKGSKITIQLTLNHEVGSLATLLLGFKQLNASLTKIESMPILGDPWNYQFFLETTMNEQKNYEDILQLLHSQTVEYRILGRYEPHKTHK